jgi:lipopolysaccharide export system protein LptA
MMRISLFLFGLFVAALGGLSAAPLHAQGIDMKAGSSGEPLTIDASGGLEWNQKEKVFTAAGPAKATRGIMVLDADELRAYYRDTPSGSSEIFRLDAIGNVRITTPGRVATGGYAVYDVDKSVIVLKDGNPVKMVSGNDVITAEGQMEFWDKRDVAVARGKARAVHADKQIQAEVMTAHFVKTKAGKTEVGRIEAFDQVRIDTPKEQAFSDRAAYNVPTGLARLTGSVKIKRGDNVLNGCSADIDLNTGINRLNTCDNAKGTGALNTDTDAAGRVHGVLSPRGKK